MKEVRDFQERVEGGQFLEVSFTRINPDRPEKREWASSTVSYRENRRRRECRSNGFLN